MIFLFSPTYNLSKVSFEVLIVPSKKKLTPKQWLLYLILLLFFILLLLVLTAFTNDKIKFKRLSEKLFVSELSGNTLSLHYTIAYPEHYGFPEQAVLPVYTKDTSAQEKTELLSLLSVLSEMKAENLSSEEAYTLALLSRFLQQRLSGTAFPYYSEPFSPNSGVQSGLPILLADYTFRRKQDIEDYLSLLDQTDEYIAGLLQYETEKAEKGLFMSEASAKKVIRQCSEIMDKKQLSEGTHFLCTTFAERLADLTASGIISKEEAENYLAKNDRLLATVMAPAYEQAADTFTLLSGKGTNDKGLFYFPDGKAYYEYLLASTTGSNRTVPEIKQLLFADFQKNYQALFSLLARYPEAGDAGLFPSFTLPPSSPEEMLTDLQSRMQKDFPAFPADEGFLPSHTVKTVSPSLENYTSPAYYLTPPIDDMSHNIIYINGKNSPDSLTLYTTLAHEGYPGHLYQTVYSQLSMNQNNVPLIRHLLHYGGYAEGWAYYVEDISYRYAMAQVKQNPHAAAYFEAVRLNRNIHLCLYSLLDIAIHYDGASIGQAAKILASVGIADEPSVNAIYRYLAEEPAVYLKYYLGYLEILNFKKEAATLWGDSFSSYRFHQFVLDAGPSDFAGLHSRLAG